MKLPMKMWRRQRGRARRRMRRKMPAHRGWMALQEQPSAPCRERRSHPPQTQRERGPQRAMGRGKGTDRALRCLKRGMGADRAQWTHQWEGLEQWAAISEMGAMRQRLQCRRQSAPHVRRQMGALGLKARRPTFQTAQKTVKEEAGWREGGKERGGRG